MPNARIDQHIVEAVAFFEEGRQHVAVAMMRDVVRQAPNYALAWWHLARVTHDHDEKLGALKTVLILEPNHQQAQVMLSKYETQPTEGTPVTESDEPSPVSEPDAPTSEVSDDDFDLDAWSAGGVDEDAAWDHSAITPVQPSPPRRYDPVPTPSVETSFGSPVSGRDITLLEKPVPELAKARLKSEAKEKRDAERNKPKFPVPQPPPAPPPLDSDDVQTALLAAESPADESDLLQTTESGYQTLTPPQPSANGDLLSSQHVIRALQDHDPNWKITEGTDGFIAARLVGINRVLGAVLTVLLPVVGLLVTLLLIRTRGNWRFAVQDGPNGPIIARRQRQIPVRNETELQQFINTVPKRLTYVPTLMLGVLSVLGGVVLLLVFFG